MWPLRTFSYIGKVSTTFLDGNTKLPKNQKGAVKKGVVPWNVTVVKKSTRVNSFIYDPIERKTLRNLPDKEIWAGFLSDARLSIFCSILMIFRVPTYKIAISDRSSLKWVVLTCFSGQKTPILIYSMAYQVIISEKSNFHHARIPQKRAWSKKGVVAWHKIGNKSSFIP